jgi:chemotaxis protein CheD
MRAAAAPSETAPPRRFLNPADGCWHIQVTQGDTYVTNDQSEVLTTILGSCIAACIRDRQAGIGGMNHFLLPSGKGGDQGATRYGVNAMEILINDILKRGGQRARLEAKLFGGASVIAGLSDVGSSNVTFAERFLADEGIALVGGNVRGMAARRIQYWPVSGRARQQILTGKGSAQIVERELAAAKPVRDDQDSNDVELF